MSCVERIELIDGLKIEYFYNMFYGVLNDKIKCL